MMEQYHRIKSQYPDKILFFRLGDFYEMFGEDAKIASRALNIALTSRAHGKGAERIPLAGVPYHSADKYINALLQAGHKVVVCEQVEDSRYAKGLVKREVVEIATPGTTIAAEDSAEGGCLIAVSLTDKKVGLAVVDFTSGEFSVDELSPDHLAERLRILKPNELLINTESSSSKLFEELGSEVGCKTEVEAHRFTLSYARRTLTDYFDVHDFDGFGITGLNSAIVAAGVALSYLQETKQNKIKHLNPPSRYIKSGQMFLDSATIRNLELVQPSIPNRGRSLFSVVDFALTAMGKRLLSNWLTAPLNDIDAILLRQQIADGFLNDAKLRDKTSEYLKALPDIERLIAKLGSSRITPRELGSLLSAAETCSELRGLSSESPQLEAKFRELPDLGELIKQLKSALLDDLPNVDNNGGIIRDGFDNRLDELKASISESKKWIAGLQNLERSRTGIQNLKVGYNKVFGYYIEVSSSHLNEVPDDYIRKQTLVNAERYITEELKKRESEVLNAEEKINDLEEELFNELVTKIERYIPLLKNNSSIIAQLDVYQSFANLSLKYNYVKPEINDSDHILIKDSRHPVIELSVSGKRFVPNDLEIGGDNGFLHIITGPNMAGKSTYLRQIGHIVILAQAGCYVPAAEARIGIVDRVFTRVGASDLLAEGKSTFLVEMNEVSNILNNATNRSLVLLDEVGRGTSTYDGLSIAWAVSEYIHEKDNLKCRTLFATHYHELTDLASRFPGIRNFQVAVREWEDQIVFLHRIIPGGCDDSYGIQVAKLAGIPSEVIGRARQILQHLETGDLFSAKRMLDKPPKWMKKYNRAQMSLFETDHEELIEKLKRVDPMAITPIEALQFLTEMVEILKKSQQK
ncbi:MAG: DNA mismatch repair protein MutS [candidate division Zixibacteria bacterium]|nr:DNA mismatch repair protein MutS [candidate division Zixibacteria bacterium]